jgi:hypothetical protein
MESDLNKKYGKPMWNEMNENWAKMIEKRRIKRNRKKLAL